MLIETALKIDSSALALALGKAVKYAKLAWLARIVAHVYQVKPANGADVWSDAYCLASPFLLRAAINHAGEHGESDPGIVFVLDNAKLAKGVGKLQAIDPAAYGRIASKTAKVNDCLMLLQLSLFGYERF